MPLDVATQESDDALLARYSDGDAMAARTLTARHAPRVFSQAMRMLADRAEAEDVAQEAMLRLWRIAPDWIAGKAKASTWLYRVTANLCTDRLRKRRGVGLDQAPEQIDDSPSALALMQAGERAKALRAAMADLPERQQEALSLRHFDDMSNPEIAEIMDTSVEAVESLLSRARRTLTTALAPKRSELGLS